MARKPRDYAAEYRRRQERARAAGFSSYWQQRKRRAADKAALAARPSQRLGLPLVGAEGFATEGQVRGLGWHLGGWRDHSGAYHDTQATRRALGDAEAPRSLGAIDQATIYVEGVGFRVWVGPFDDEFTLEDDAREAADFYGVGSAE